MTAGCALLRNGCKINLYLRVGARRPDGYHDIESLFLPLDEPHDEIRVSPLDGAPGRIAVSFHPAGPATGANTSPDISPGASPDTPPNTSPEPAPGTLPGVSSGVAPDTASDASPGVVATVHGIDSGRNTLTKAYALFAEASGFAPPLAVRVTKGIPHGAGLGGGSANAAALLLHLQRLARQAGATPLPEPALAALAARVGADVPFFLTARPSFVSGIGDTLVPCDQPFPGRHMVLVCPAVSVSTAWAFNALDELRAHSASKAPPFPAGVRRESARRSAPERTAQSCAPRMQKNTADLLTSGPPRASNSLAQAQDCTNDFEDLVFAHFPVLARLHAMLRDSGAELARMSGTGASLFAVYGERRIAEKAAKRLANENASVYTQRLLAG